MTPKPRHAMHLTEDFRAQPEHWTPGRDFDWLIFIDKATGEKIMVIHGSDHGSFQQYGSGIVEAENPDIIYCCHPWHVSRITGNRKIMFADSKRTFYVGIRFIKDKLRMVTIEEAKFVE